MARLNIRSLFSKIFGNDTGIKYGSNFKLLNCYQSIFTQYDGNVYDNVDARACIDAIARNAAKLNPKHIRKGNNGFENLNDNLEHLLSEQPNELQNAYDFYYTVISELEIYNDAFIYISRDKALNILGLYPIHSGNYQFLEYKNNIFIKFKFGSGTYYTANIFDIIHLKRHWSPNDMTGGNNYPIVNALSLKHVLDEGLINAIKTTQSIKGAIKSTKAMLNPDDVKKMRDQFVTDFINSSDGSGIGGLDATTDFIPISINPTTASDSQVLEIDEKILNYYGLSKEIIQSRYDENQWNAFYESVIEPIGLQMALEFTNKLFTLGEKQHQNKIMFTSNRLQYASNTTKVAVSKQMQNYMTVNEIREIFNLEPIEDGDKILQSLNNIDSSIANQYQVGDTSTDNQDNENGGEDNGK